MEKRVQEAGKGGREKGPVPLCCCTMSAAFPSPHKSIILPFRPPAPEEGRSAADLEGLVCSSMASTALSTELSRDWVWFAVSFSRKRVTNWSTLLPLSYTCRGTRGAR